MGKGRRQNKGKKCRTFELVETRLPDGRIVSALRDTNPNHPKEEYTVAGVTFDKTGLYIPEQTNIRYDGDSERHSDDESSYAWDSYDEENKIEMEEYIEYEEVNEEEKEEEEEEIKKEENSNIKIMHIKRGENYKENKDEMEFLKMCAEEEGFQLEGEDIEAIEISSEYENDGEEDQFKTEEKEIEKEVKKERKEKSKNNNNNEDIQQKKRRKIQHEEIQNEEERKYFEKELDEVLNMEIDSKILEEGKDIIIKNGRVVNTIKKGATIVEAAEKKLIIPAHNIDNPEEYEKKILEEEEKEQIVQLASAGFSSKEQDEKALYATGETPKDTIRVIQVSKKVQDDLMALLGFSPDENEEEEEEEEEKRKLNKKSHFTEEKDGAYAQEMNDILAFWDDEDNKIDKKKGIRQKVKEEEPNKKKKDLVVLKRLNTMSDEQKAELAELAEMFGCDDINTLTQDQLKNLLELGSQISDQDKKVAKSKNRKEQEIILHGISGRARRIMSKAMGEISPEKAAIRELHRKGTVEYGLDILREQNMLGPQLTSEQTIELLRQREEAEEEIHKNGGLTSTEKFLQEWAKPNETKTILDDLNKLYKEDTKSYSAKTNNNSSEAVTSNMIKATLADGKTGIKISTVTGLPLDASSKARIGFPINTPENSVDNKKEDEDDEENVTIVFPSNRPRNETKEQKEMRKYLTSMAKKSRAEAKSKLKNSFKNVEKQQKQLQVNNIPSGFSKIY